MKKYVKDGKDCILCLTRKKLIQFTPEEEVRQNFIQKLVDEYDVPIELIESELPLSHIKKGIRGRVDILVSALNDNNRSYPLMIVECKASSIPLTDKTFDQMERYDLALNTNKVMIMTNGIETYCYAWDEKTEDHRRLKEIPNYNSLVKGDKLDYKKEIKSKWTRPNHKGNLEENKARLLEDVNLGSDTEDKYVSLVTNLVGLLIDESELATALPLKTKNLVSDNGLRYTTFGNAGGGSWPGLYRYFIVENSDKESEIVSISIIGRISTKDHPKYGTLKGTTTFIVAIDDFENSHNSLQYSMDKYVKCDGDKYYFWHDGTLTNGGRGRVKNKEVVDFISAHGNHLIKDGKIYLGEVDNTKELKWQQEDVQNLIANFIDYGFLRDDFRRKKREELK